MCHIYIFFFFLLFFPLASCALRFFLGCDIVLQIWESIDHSYYFIPISLSSFWGFKLCICFITADHSTVTKMYYESDFCYYTLSLYFSLSNFYYTIFKTNIFASAVFKLLMKPSSEFYLHFRYYVFNSRGSFWCFSSLYLCCVSPGGHWSSQFRQWSSITGKTLKQRVTRKLIINEPIDGTWIYHPILKQQQLQH